MLSLEGMLTQPGTDIALLGSLGPVAFHRLCMVRKSLVQLEAPWLDWEQSFTPPHDPETAEKKAFALIQSADVGKSIADCEALVDELFVLTAFERPKIQTSKPTHNLLDAAVKRVLRPVIGLLRMRGYTLEFLDVYSLESHVQDDNYEAVAAYLQAGISPDIRANAGRSVLMVAMNSKAEKVGPLLLSCKADVHQCSGFGGWTALMWASHVGWEDGCKFLLNAGARPEDKNAQGQSAFDIAQTRGRTSIASLLSSARSDV